MMKHTKIANFFVVFLCVMAITVIGATATEVNSNDTASSYQLAQRPRGTSDAWQRVYEILPEIPRENQYTHVETGDIETDNTLIGRLIRYHLYVKGRPYQYRLDWKLTLADYLGENEIMNEGVYPGYDTLETNPLLGDREAIQSLTPQQRDDLVHVLVSIFYPTYLTLLEEQANLEGDPAASASEPTDLDTPPRRGSDVPQLPRSGDAELLLP
ncbi:hypothetical protein [Baaleninema simplex]|uniref:hypothetical protein n=1 Tax=Baaleninema simplex TaxID=2862350 RepID=UPI00054F4AFE|nr:hypothetical protein [Baaleninema simplex]